MSLGKKLYNLRKQKGVSQEALAYELGLSSQSSYSDWENDISIPKNDNIIRLSNYYDIDVNELLQEVFPSINITNEKNAIALVNSPNSNINQMEAIIKLADGLEKLNLIVENILGKKN